MNNHQPQNYQCPFCLLTSGEDTKYNKVKDIVYQDAKTLAFISPKWWPNNPGNVLVIPKKHVENIYDIDEKLLASVYITGKKLAHAIKATYQCDGISFRQHNEPAGNQDVWHFHLHVFPRWDNDNLYVNHLKAKFIESNKKTEYAFKLKKYFNQIS